MISLLIDIKAKDEETKKEFSALFAGGMPVNGNGKPILIDGHSDSEVIKKILVSVLAVYGFAKFKGDSVAFQDWLLEISPQLNL